MKCFKIVAAAVALTAAGVFAAGPEVVIGGGLNMSNVMMSGDYELPDGVDKKMGIGFNAGVNARFAFDDKMGLVAGLNYETRGIKMEADGMTITQAANYLQVPVLFSYKAVPALAINVGPEIGLFIGGKAKAEVGGVKVEEDLEDVSLLDLGLSVGLSYTFAEVVVVSAGYYLGLLNTDDYDYEGDGPDGAVKNTNIKISIGYLLKL